MSSTQNEVVCRLMNTFPIRAAGPRHDIDGRARALQSEPGTGNTPWHCIMTWKAGGTLMKLEWHKPEVVEEEVGLEVTSYASAELDRT